MKAAEAALREAFALPARIDFAEFNRKAWPEFLLDRGRTEEALAASEELVNGKWAMARFAGHALAGRVYCSLNQMDNAENELRLAEQETEQIRPAILKLLTDSVLLRAEILLREKKWEEANPLMQKIENDLVAVPGPDAWSEALFQLEYIARVAREAGDWELAESTAQRMIKHDPSYAGGYFALSLAAEHKGDSLAAKQEFAKGEKLWSKADAQLKSTPTQKP